MFRVVFEDIWWVCAWIFIVKIFSQTLFFVLFIPHKALHLFEWTAVHHNAVFVAFFFWLLHLHFTKLYNPFIPIDTLE